MISANKFTRDFGTKQEEIILSGSGVCHLLNGKYS